MAGMFNSWFVAGLTLVYLGLLFLVARVAENASRRPDRPAPVWPYALGLSVYCTSWSIYGTTAQAATGWFFPPTYVGTIILFVAALPVIRKLIAASAAHNVTSIADFVASRYGKSRSLAVTVTLLAVVCAAPYIALQFKAAADSLDLLAGGSAFPIDTAFVVAALMGAFALTFGVGRLSNSGRNQGLIMAIAADGIIKLAAIVLVGVYAVFVLHDGPASLVAAAARAGLLDGRPQASSTGDAFLASVVLGVLAILCLPQIFFALTADEEMRGARLRRASRLFLLYLVGMGIFTWPILAAAELAGITTGAGYHALLLPLEAGAPLVALAVYLGGIAAATSLVIAASVAVGVMVGNELVAPLFMRRSLTLPDLAAPVRISRRIAIAGLIALAYGYYRLADETASLASIGLTSMVLAAQFAPAILGGLYWREGSAPAVAVGLGIGTLAWGVLLFTAEGLALADDLGTDRHALALAISLALNSGAFVIVSRLVPPSTSARAQAASFVDADTSLLARSEGQVALGDLTGLVGRVIGPQAAEEAFHRYRRDRAGDDVPADQPADARSIVFAERLIAGVVGAASARILMRSLLDRGVEASDVATFAEEAGRVFRFNRDLLQASLDNVSIAIAVVDKQLRMVAWNRAYEDLFDYPPGLLHEGRHVRDLIRYNAQRGECGDGHPDDLVERRLRHLRARTPYTFQRHRRDGRVLDIRGNPMPGGGFVTSYADVTGFVRAERAQRELADTLEQRVAARTRELQGANEALEAAKRVAEEANASKTRMFAAVSHDVLQPLHAARLLAASIERDVAGGRGADRVSQLQSSLDAVQDLLSEVLELTRLDAVSERPRIERVPVAKLFSEVAEAFAPVAERSGCRIRVAPTATAIETDRRLIQRVLRNYLANALRYGRGRDVLIGVRRAGPDLRLEVWDLGPGVPEEHQALIFKEFQRLGPQGDVADRGLGLGLAIVERIARLLGCKTGLRSRPGKGSVFSVTVRRAEDLPARAAGQERPSATFPAISVLCIDDDRRIRDAMRALLEGWGCEVETSADGSGFQERSFDVVFLDHHLADGRTGLDIAGHHAARAGLGVIISADRTDAPRRAAAERGFGFIEKPVREAQLRAVLQSAAMRRQPAG